MVRRSDRPAVVLRAHFANDARGDTEHQGPCRGGEALGEHRARANDGALPDRVGADEHRGGSDEHVPFDDR